MASIAVLAGAALHAGEKTKTTISKATRQTDNENSAKFFAVGMSAMIFLFVLVYWARFLFIHYGRGHIVLLRFIYLPRRIARKSRRILLLKVPGFTSAGHALLFLGYLTTCITVSFVNIDWSSLINWSKRLGWVAVSNLAFLTFLALKNTPLGFLTGYTYERLNILHQVAGYCTITWSLLHAVVYIVAWSQTNSLSKLLEKSQVMGIIGGFSMLVILATVLFLRRLRYEVFYIVHIVMFMLILIVIGMHRPDLSQKTLVIVIFAASIWILDRALRFIKISVFGFGNTATVTPLQCGGTRITLRRAPRGAAQGSHCFLWIPGIRMAETHPFTVVSMSPFEFVVGACDGFTRDLHEFALKNPNRSLRASVDGPYGSAPDFTGATTVIFIAGGSGASFSLGVAVDLVRKLGDSKSTSIEIVWVIRESEMIEWYAAELEVLESSPIVTMHIHVTRSSSSSNPTPISYSPRHSLADSEKSSSQDINNTSSDTPTSLIDSEKYDVEKHPGAHFQYPRPTRVIKSGRPNIAQFITQVVEKADVNDRLVVTSCGPDSLMQTTRRTVAGCISLDGPSLELHCEQFGF